MHRVQCHYSLCVRVVHKLEENLVAPTLQHLHSTLQSLSRRAVWLGHAQRRAYRGDGVLTVPRLAQLTDGSAAEHEEASLTPQLPAPCRGAVARCVLPHGEVKSPDGERSFWYCASSPGSWRRCG